MMMIAPSSRLVTFADAMALSGASRKQVDYWDRQGLLTYAVPAAGSGSRRGFSELDVLRLRAMAIASSALAGPDAGGRAGSMAVVADAVMDATAAELQGPFRFWLGMRVELELDLSGWSRVLIGAGQ